jgi:hypothetical protein
MQYVKGRDWYFYGTDTAALDFLLTVAAAWALATWRWNMSIWMVILLLTSFAAHPIFASDDSMANNMNFQRN